MSFIAQKPYVTGGPRGRLSSWGEQAWDTVYVSGLRLVCLNTIFVFYRISSEIGTFAESRKGVCCYANLEGIL